VLEPSYGAYASAALDKIEKDRIRRKLWNAICDAIDLVCDRPDSAEARLEAVRLPSGLTIWQIPIRCPVEEDNWVLLWHRDGEEAVIHYIGSSIFR
jgi:hypothetical protein